MIDHLSLGTAVYAQAVEFYGQVLRPLGLRLQRDTGEEAAYGTPAQWAFFLYPVEPGTSVTAPKMHVALAAPGRSAVQAVHRLALEQGGRDLFSPRTRPDISPTYYGAMFSDLDGHRIEVLTQASA